VTVPPPVQPIPTGSILLHIGAHKTGTTALQAALSTARGDLLRQGVRLTGRSRKPGTAVRAVTGQGSPYSETRRIPGIRHWQRLVREVRDASEPRVVVSSEIFAWAGADAVRRIVDDVGAERIQVAVTLRPLARIVPSMWQQNVQGGARFTIDDWLRAVLNRSAGGQRHTFWRLHRHDELIARWVDVVGSERVTGVVVDERDHGVLMRAFEQLLGVAPGTLVPPVDLMNRSLTLPEAEAVRAFNVAFMARDLPRSRHARLMRFGAAQVMKQREPPSDERRVELPAWAVEPVAAIQREMVDNIRRSGIRIVGDLDRLLDPPQAGSGSSAPVLVPPDAAAAMAIGLVVAAGQARPGQREGRVRFAEPEQIANVPSRRLAVVLVVRGRRWLGRTADRAAARLRRLVRPRRNAET
jgi:hypothetical protein